jgi:hypothetical protein
MGPPCGQRLPKRPSQNPRVFWALWAWRVVCVFWARGVQTQKHFRAQKKSKEVKGLLTSFGLGYYGRVEWSKDRVQTQKKWSKEEPLARFFRAPLGLLGLLGGVQTGPSSRRGPGQWLPVGNPCPQLRVRLTYKHPGPLALPPLTNIMISLPAECASVYRRCSGPGARGG